MWKEAEQDLKHYGRWINMAIPDFQTIMLPLLELASEREERSIRKAVEKLAMHFSLTDEEINKLQPSGQGPVFLRGLVGHVLILRKLVWLKTLDVVISK